MEPRAAGMLIVVAGLVLVVLGLVVWAGGFGWFGRLPGDLRFGSDNVRVYAPLGSMLVLSLVLTLLLTLFRRFF
jgi:hypothetical protein